LIPSLQDYRSNGLHQNLWWQPSDLEDFKIDAVRELITVMKDHSLDVKDALSYLYQPHELSSSCETTSTDPISSFSSESDDGPIELLPDHASRAYLLNIELGLRSKTKNESVQYIHPLAVLGL
jgi:hypothetical protein